MENFTRKITMKIVDDQIVLPFQEDVEAWAIETLGTHGNIFTGKTPFAGGELVYENRGAGKRGWFLNIGNFPAPASLPSHVQPVDGADSAAMPPPALTASSLPSHGSSGVLHIDGVQVSPGMAILFTGNANPAGNGIYRVSRVDPVEPDPPVRTMDALATEIMERAGVCIQGIATFPNMKASDAMRAFRHAVEDTLHAAAHDAAAPPVPERAS